MHFKITARTILQLGAELISSDAIAFYELIKNAFDAGSKKVEVRIVKRLTTKITNELIEKIEKSVSEENFLENYKSFQEEIIANSDPDSYRLEAFKDRIRACDQSGDLINAVKKANYILISDWGVGMSLTDLDDIYLTIGTTNRQQQKKNLQQGDQPILGEKGLGRLSVMRLGDSLFVETTQQNEDRYNNLDIDWKSFEFANDKPLESVIVEPKKGKLKVNLAEKGTKIYIYHLKEDWTVAKLEQISEAQLTRFIDPFQNDHRDFITLWFNNEPVIIPNIDRVLFKYAHATASVKLTFDEKGAPSLSGDVNYRFYNRTKTFQLSGVELNSILEPDFNIHLLKQLGPFQGSFYWYNRQMLTAKMGVTDHKYIRELVDTWAGGLMLYRDGFRVNPYGGPNDDWLGLDAIALSSPGYKLNRKQIIGKVDIGSINNRKLIDQTNREGLQDTIEKSLLIRLLQHFITTEVRTFLDAVKKDYDQNTAAESLAEIEKRIDIGHYQVRAAINELKDKYPVIQTEGKLLSTIEDVLDESSKLFKIAKASSEELKARIKTTLELAGLGLMVDVIAHELNRSTAHALSTIDSISNDSSAVDTEAAMETLRKQLKTLQARLKVIDPLGPSGRQKKESVFLLPLITESVDSHLAQFERHSIVCNVHDNGRAADWKVRIVPGMIVQIIENLISNSVYWLKQQKVIDSNFRGKITINIDRGNNSILFTDNGPGISRERKEEIFRPFFTTKPPGDGKGLGLYISRELAKYHDADFYLWDDMSREYLNTFILTLKKPKTL